MKQIIVPEVIRKELSRPQQGQTLNINLNKNIDKRSYDLTQSYTTNNTTVNNNTNKGLIGFILELVILPFKLVKLLFKSTWVKYGMKEKLRLDKIKGKQKKFLLKYLRSTNRSYDFEEIL